MTKLTRVLHKAERQNRDLTALKALYDEEVGNRPEVPVNRFTKGVNKEDARRIRPLENDAARTER